MGRSYLQANRHFLQPPPFFPPLILSHLHQLLQAFNLKKVKFHLSAEWKRRRSDSVFLTQFNGTIVQVEAEPIRPGQSGGKT